jgi:L-lactate dehydrogenase (cytochrome)
MAIASTADFREAARRRLPPFLFHYIDGGAYAETTLRRNVEDLAAVALRQRVLKDVSALSLETELFGRRQSLPIALGPVGLSGMYARRGEVAAARAAAAHDIPFCLSTLGICSIEEVTKGTGRPIWFQLYVLRDRGYTREMIARAKAAGCTALLFTVDLAVPGTRWRDWHSGMSGRWAPVQRAWQALTHPRWAWDVGLKGRPHALGNVAREGEGLGDYKGWIGQHLDPSISWKDLEFVRQVWDGPVIIKGILDVEDAREAVAIGADGIVVSNHGGRQLDGVRSTARALPGIVEAVGGELTVLVDGGVRSGLDVLKMLALGAKGVLLGRAWAFALAAGGGAGVDRLLTILAAELRVAMALSGVTDVRKVDVSAVEPA